MNLTVKVRNGHPVGPAGRRHLDHRVAELAKRLPEKVSTSSALTVVIDTLPKKALTRMAVRLALPGRLLTAADEGKDEMTVINRVFGELTRMVTKARQRRGVRAPGITTMRQAVRGQPVLIASDINALSRFIEGEFEQLAQEGGLPADAPTAREVLSDVLLQALETWESRPEGMPVMPYLFRLAVERIDRESARVGEAESGDLSLDTREPRSQPQDQAVGMNEDYWEFWQPDDSPSMEDVVAASSAEDPFDIIQGEEERRILQGVLKDLPPPARQAVMLAETEAFEADDIALIQGRPMEDVVRDLAEGRRLLDRAEGA